MPTHSGGDDATSAEARDFYRRSFATMADAGIPFLLGGAFALAHYAGVERYTKDVDVFIRPADCERLLQVLGASGCATERTFSHWLAKARCGDDFMDIIFSSGNAVCAVDDEWFAHAEAGEIFGVPVRLSPVEEMIWSKAFIQERERFDGADVAHLLRARGDRLDWPRLVGRFGEHWRVLLAHLVLYGFVYPGDRDRVPRTVLDDLTARLAAESASPPPATRLCRGTLLSRLQYDIDLRRWAYVDARVEPEGGMTPQEARRWTDAGKDEERAAREGAELAEEPRGGLGKR